MEPHSLWEYPSTPLSDVYEIYSFNFAESLDQIDSNKPQLSRETTLKLKHNGLLNGIVAWHEIHYDNESQVLNTGLLKEPEQNKKLEWNKNYRQAVNILDSKYPISQESISNCMSVKCLVNFELKAGKFNVDFKVDN
jgi:hypothetical protein